MLMGMLFTATAASVNRVIAGSHIGLNSANPEKTQVLPRTVVLDPSTLVKLKQDFNDGNNTKLDLSCTRWFSRQVPFSTRKQPL